MDQTEMSDDHTGERLKHLEFAQGVISRLAGNSAAMKRYCLVVVAAGLAAFKTLGEDPWVIVAVAALVAVFWLLDSRYLQQEKWFRDLYDQVRSEPIDVRPDFRLTPDRGSASFLGRVLSWSTAGLYMPLVALLAIFWRLL